MDKKISIVIPCYPMAGKGVEFLKFSLDKLSEQSLPPYEVIVADHSTHFNAEAMQNLCKQYPFVKYYLNPNDRGNPSANLNFAISKATGDFIKVLFQDDFLYDKDSLKKISDKLDGNTYWFVTGCEHSPDGITMTRPFYPKYNEDIHLGNNTISSPSVLTFANFNPLEFDEELNWLMDVDYYKRLHKRYGNPKILNEICVVNRQHPDQQTNLLTQQEKDAELELIKKKYV